MSYKSLGLLICLVALPLVSKADDRDLFARALNLSQQGQWQQAADLYTQIASRNPQWPEPRNNLAVSLMQLGKIEQAQQALDAAVTSQAVYRTAHLNRQRIFDYLAAQAYDKAVGQKNTIQPPKLDLVTRLELPEPVFASSSPVAAPVVAATPAKNTTDVILNAVSQQVQSWAQAWSKGDIKNYLASYSSAFKSEDGITFEQWANSRRLRLQTANNVQVATSELHVYVDSAQTQVLAEFVQQYRADKYQDRVVKQLLMVQESGRWLIVAERVIAKL